MRLKTVFAAALCVTAHAAVAATPLKVTTAIVTTRVYHPTVTVLAKGRSNEHIVIDAPFSGVMAPLPLRPGTAVVRNTVLARILPLRLAADVEAATAQEDSARKSYAESAILAREGLLTAAQLAQAKARARHARAVLEGLEARLSRGTVQAPFPGTVSYLVPAGAWVVPGTAIARLSGTGGFYLTAPMSPAAARILKPGDPARIEAEKHSWRGQVYAVGERAGRGGLVTVYLRCHCRLFAGEFTRVQLRGQGESGAAVPKHAVVMMAGQAFIYEIKGGRAQAVKVTIVHADRHWVWVHGPVVMLGAKVVVTGAGRIRTGTPVIDTAQVGVR